MKGEEGRTAVSAPPEPERPQYRSESARGLDDYFEQVAANYAALANPFDYYRWLVDEISALRDVDLAPLSQGLNNPGAELRRVYLRHDIDADPLTALRAARHLARCGLAGSFYLLHTAPYYGQFIDRTFVRQPALEDWIQGFVVAGCELGLHNDVLGAIIEHGVDGIELLRTELQWLREQGANVQGTVAHNSAPVHGAENFEIFAGHVLWEREVLSPDGRPLPLGRLDPVAAGLGYEGTWARPKQEGFVASAAEAFVAHRDEATIRNEKWMRRYLVDNPICDWQVDGQWWLIGRDRWVAGGRVSGEPFYEFGIDGRRVIRMLADLPGGARAVLVVHPEYVRL